MQLTSTRRKSRGPAEALCFFYGDRPHLLKLCSEGDSATMSYPAWNDLSTEQKCQFLYDWCETLTRKIERQEEAIQALNARLRAIDEKVANSETW